MNNFPKKYRFIIIIVLAAISLLSTLFIYKQKQPETITLLSGNDLRQFLTEGDETVFLKKESIDTGCLEGESACFYFFDDIRISQEKEALYKDNRPLTLVSYPIETQTPDLNRDPLAAYSVSVQGEHWGSCIEFSHSGLGKSGEQQRWTSTILIPNGNTEKAFKTTGYHWYQPSCEFLTAPAHAPEQLILSEISRSNTTPIQYALYRYTCTVMGCSTVTGTEGISVSSEAVTISF